MTTGRDVSGQVDIGKMKTEADGSFKRLDASFRNFIVPGTKFEAEAGAWLRCRRLIFGN